MDQMWQLSFIQDKRPWHKSPKHVKRLEPSHVYEQISKFFSMSNTYTFIKIHK